MGAGRIRVEAVYALPDQQLLVSLELDAGATAADAVRASGVIEAFAGTCFEKLSLAIWGNPVPPETLLRDGDRVDILRPLRIDPREARRQLAEKGGVMGN
jgi:putative ubiquitin-RnfH superfamily antitoxin RatB of RatAB toxin-antitoxin module